jgi:hypothetical protein
MRNLPMTQTAPAWDPPARIPILEAGDLPGDEDWAVLESLRSDCGVDPEFDPDTDRFGELMVARGAFD